MDAFPSPAQVWLLRAVGTALVLATIAALVAMAFAALIEGRVGPASIVTALAAFPVVLGYALVFAVRHSVTDADDLRD